MRQGLLNIVLSCFTQQYFSHKFKKIEGHKFRISKILISVFDRVKNIAEKGDKSAMMALEFTPNTMSQQNKFYLIFMSIEQNCEDTSLPNH